MVFPFESDTQTVEVEYVRVRKPDGSVVNTSPDDSRDLDSQITQAAPLYSDLREKHVPVKGLAPGDVLEYATHWQVTKMLTPGQFWVSYAFARTSIVLNETLDVSVPADRAITISGPVDTQNMTMDGSWRKYTWSNSNLTVRTKPKTGSAALDEAFHRTRGPDVLISSFLSWDDVGRWYWDLQKDRLEPTEEIRAKAAELTKGAADDLAKITAIYNFVSTHYRYVGVDFGIGRYKPHAAADVLTNNFGDCKDKETLLASLLGAEGITVYPALINSAHSLDPKSPSPAQFDHVIGYVRQGTGGLWLDTTPEVTPKGYLMPTLRDKQALVIWSEKSAQLLTTPAEPEQLDGETFKVDAKLGADGVVTAKIEDTSTSDGAVLFRALFRQFSEAQYQEFVQQVSYRLGFSGAVSNVRIDPPDQTAGPFHFSYSYLRKDYPEWQNHRFTVPDTPMSLTSPADDADPNESVFLGSLQRNTSEVKVELPEGYVPVAPENVDLVHDYAEYHASYKVTGNTLDAQRSFSVKRSLVPAAEVSDYRKFLRKISDDRDQYVETMSSHATASAPSPSFGLPPAPTVPAPGNFNSALSDSGVPEANRLLQEALGAARSDPASAIPLLQRAVSADPKFVRAWLTLTTLQLRVRKPDDAIDSLHRAITANPTQPLAYKMLAQILATDGRKDDAVAVWQDLMKAIPDDADAPGRLGDLLLQQKRYAEATSQLQAAVRKNPNDAPATANLAAAYMLSGNLEQGRSMLSHATEFSLPAPLILNNVAYALADNGQDLPDALAYSQEAVSGEEEVAQKIDLYHLANADLASTQTLAEFWDTLGWVQFRLGHLDEAENYLKPAWQVSQYAVIADHLGQVYEGLHKTHEAVEMYQYALVTIEHRLPADRQQAIRARLKTLDPKAETSALPGIGKKTPVDELLAMRVVKLPRLVKGSASGEFFLLFAPGKVQDAQFISGADELADSEHALMAAPFQVPFPTGSSGRIIRRGVVECTQAAGCEITLYPLDSVRSVK